MNTFPEIRVTPPSPPVRRPRLPKREIIILVVLGGSGISVLLCWLTISSHEPRPYYGNSWSAADLAEEFVKDRLKAPGTARFAEPFRVKLYDTHQWSVIGQVTAQNPFGVPLRHTYLVILSTTDGSHWKCETVLFDEDLKHLP